MGVEVSRCVETELVSQDPAHIGGEVELFGNAKELVQVGMAGLEGSRIIEAHEVSTTRSKSPMFFGSWSEDARRFVTCYCGVVTSVVTSIGL